MARELLLVDRYCGGGGIVRVLRVEQVDPILGGPGIGAGQTTLAEMVMCVCCSHVESC